MKSVVKLSFLLLLAIACFAQESNMDIVYLKNGGIINGKIIEQIADKSVKIQTADKNIFVYKMDEVERIIRGSLTGVIPENKSKCEEPASSLSLNAGMSLPTGKNYFSESWKSGYNISLGYNMPLVENLFLTANVDYNFFPLDNDKFLQNYINSASLEGGTISIITFGAGLMSKTSLKTDKLYLRMGLEAGLFSMSMSDIKVDYSYSSYKYSYTVSSESETGLRMMFGAGVEYVLSKSFNLTLGFDYAVCFTKNENTSFIPVKAGVVYNL